MGQFGFRPKSLFVFIALIFLLHSSYLVVKGAKRKSEETIVNSIGMKCRLIPAGKFLMGSRSVCPSKPKIPQKLP